MFGVAVLIFSTPFLTSRATSDNSSQERNSHKLADTYFTGDPRICLRENQNLQRLQVLPGWGWDNLRNVDGNNVMVYNYSRCRTTLDGRFLIPDDVETIPRKSSSVNTYAELISSYMDYTSATSHSANVHAGFSGFGVSVSGSFSYDYQRVKRKQIGGHTATARVQMRYVRYTARLRSKFNLHPDFKIRLLDIAENIGSNRSDEVRYQCQLLVRDFGTHFLKSVDAGAVLVQEDQISSSYANAGASTKQAVGIAAAASGSFFARFNFGASYEYSSSQTNSQKYNEERTSSEILSYGGPKFKAFNFTVNDWAELVDQNMVTIDRRGEPLQYLVTKANLPELSTLQVRRLHAAVKEAILLYYKYNSYSGCTDMDDPNFSPIANINDGTCGLKVVSKSFGGTFQKCNHDPRSSNGNLCSKYNMNQLNPITSDYSCPVGYNTVELNNGVLETVKPRPDCYRCNFNFYLCCASGGRVIEFKYSQATYSSYWCAGDSAVDRSGYLFGGLFTSNFNNPVTQAKKCPPKFYTRQLGTSLKICLSDYNEAAKNNSVSFGGFISCLSGNPFAISKDLTSGNLKNHSMTSFMKNSGTLPRRCPDGFNQQLAYVDQGCEILYCLRSKTMTDGGITGIRRPPFLEPPANVKSTQYVVKDPDTEKWMPLEEMKIPMVNHGSVGAPLTSDGHLSFPSIWLVVSIAVIFGPFSPSSAFGA